jgi:hypothetical protein
MDRYQTTSRTHFRHQTHDVYVADAHGVLLVNPVHPQYVQPDRFQHCEQFYHKQLSPDNMRLRIPVGMETLWSMSVFTDHIVICRHRLLHNNRLLGDKSFVPVPPGSADQTAPTAHSTPVIHMGSKRLSFGAMPQSQPDLDAIDAFVGRTGCIVDLRSQQDKKTNKNNCRFQGTPSFSHVLDYPMKTQPAREHFRQFIRSLGAYETLYIHDVERIPHE